MLRLCTKSLLAIASACAALSSSAFALPVYLLQWGGAGYDDGQFMYIRSVAVAPSGRVYVTNSYDHPRVHRHRDGTHSRSIDPLSGCPLARVVTSPQRNRSVQTRATRPGIAAKG